MIYPRKSPLFERLFLIGLRWTMRRRFFGIFVKGGEHLGAASAKNAPLLVCSNHSNWWDGFAAGMLVPQFSKHSMHVAQYELLIKKYPVCRWLGAFAIDLDGSPLPGLRYALKLLESPDTAVWIFPQGVIIPQREPIVLKPGATWLAKKRGAWLVPVVFHYDWMLESRPSIFVNCGPPLPSGTSMETLQSEMQRLYDEMAAAMHPLQIDDYKPLFKLRPSLNRRWDWILGRDLDKVRN
jgi:1-acyl-sn-glycerol-3-phosphate acyltransferase